ncbi:microtubule-associated protein RP/EB family member 1 [Drosophila erecta]|uniref:Calponin-homology (CH) domain-containing protein n=1 Tax=Drosophila erecta TaxID=7220 RepID=B3NW41_DROER|nr:microtubule-associated protein RP/EB family member 1 [Drosophila erecta]EDV46174.1 uncharacterized protein Dere_GG18930 [Drosophila erecta]
MPPLRAQNVTVTHNSLVQWSRAEILDWFNETLKCSLTNIEHLCTGAAYCNLMHMLFPKLINLKRVKFFPNQQYEFVANFKELQKAFNKVKVIPPVQVNKVIHGRCVENFEFAVWFRHFFMANYNKEKCSDYDVLVARDYQDIGMGSSRSSTPVSATKSRRGIEIVKISPRRDQGKTAFEDYPEAPPLKRESQMPTEKRDGVRVPKIAKIPKKGTQQANVNKASDVNVVTPLDLPGKAGDARKPRQSARSSTAGLPPANQPELHRRPTKSPIRKNLEMPLMNSTTRTKLSATARNVTYVKIPQLDLTGIAIDTPRPVAPAMSIKPTGISGRNKVPSPPERPDSSGRTCNERVLRMETNGKPEGGSNRMKQSQQGTANWEREPLSKRNPVKQGIRQKAMETKTIRMTARAEELFAKLSRNTEADHMRHNSQDSNDQDANDQGANDQGWNDQGANDQDSNDQDKNDQDANGQGTNDQGWNDQGANDQDKNDQGANDQDKNDQDKNDQGANDQHTNDQGTNNLGTNDQVNDGQDKQKEIFKSSVFCSRPASMPGIQDDGIPIGLSKELAQVLASCELTHEQLLTEVSLHCRLQLLIKNTDEDNDVDVAVQTTVLDAASGTQMGEAAKHL